MPARSREKEVALSPEAVRLLFSYNSETGLLSWARPPRRGVSIGPAGVRNDDGYLIVGYKGHLYMGIHIIWCWMTGEWPEHGVDHKDLDQANDVWSNLRQATYQQNNRNRPVRKDSETGVKGVQVNKRNGKFRARITVDKKIIHLGEFLTLAAATAVREKAEVRLFGEFSTLHKEAA